MKTYVFATYSDYKSGKLTGAHRRYLELINYVSEKNQVILVSGEIPQLTHPERIKQYSIPNGKIGGIIPFHISGMIRLKAVLTRIQKCENYDEVIIFGAPNTICAYQSGMKNINVFFREDLIGYREAIGESKLKLRYLRKQENRAVTYAKKIFVQCKNDYKHLLERNSNVKDIAQKTYIQINNSNASWMETQKNIVRGNDSSGRINILFIGHFSNSRKGHSLLIPAINRLTIEGYKIELWIAGGGIEQNKYKKQYEENPHLHFLGFINDINYYLGICDFLIVPSLIDSCPNTVLEGLEAGIAVYGARTGGIPDLLLEERYMFDPTEDAIYAFVRNVADNHSYKQDCINQKYLKERLCFDWCKTILEKIG